MMRVRQWIEVMFDLLEKEIVLNDNGYEAYIITCALLKEEALSRIEESYYSSDNSMGEMSRFKEDINLIKELVNEHFKDNVETNFEHFKDEIIEDYSQNLAVVKGRPTLCYKTNCNDCDFKINQIGCREKAKDC
jgi:hypothetical protein